MLFIDRASPKMALAIFEHWKYYKCRIYRKIGNPACSSTCEICSETKERAVRYRSDSWGDICDYLNTDSNLEDIVLGEPQLIKDKHDVFLDHLNIDTEDLNYYLQSDDRVNHNLHKIISDLNSIFNYKEFSGAEVNSIYSAYKLAMNLERRTCTYCNRMYTTTLSTIGGKKIMRPHFDHWFPKSKFPGLAVSFFNLIPSCYNCNSSIKSDIEMDLDLHIHPYIDVNSSSEFTFNYIYGESLKKYRVFITPSNQLVSRKAFDTMKLLLIDEMYNTHHSELKDLIDIKQAYSKLYINKMSEFFPKSGLETDEVYRLLFGVERDSSNFHLRPLSKFKKDILLNLGIDLD